MGTDIHNERDEIMKEHLRVEVGAIAVEELISVRKGNAARILASIASIGSEGLIRLHPETVKKTIGNIRNTLADYNGTSKSVLDLIAFQSSVSGKSARLYLVAESEDESGGGGGKNDEATGELLWALRKALGAMIFMKSQFGPECLHEAIDAADACIAKYSPTRP